MNGEQDALALGLGDLGGQKDIERGPPHHGGVDHLALQDGDFLLEHGDVALVVDVLDAHRAAPR